MVSLTLRDLAILTECLQYSLEFVNPGLKHKTKDREELLEKIEGNKITCGLPSDHKCDNKGPGTLLLNDSPFEVLNTTENQIKYKDKICGSSVNCSICGRSAYLNSFWEQE